MIQQLDENTNAGATGEVNAPPGELLTSILVKLEDQLIQSTAQDDPGNWGKQAMARIRDWMGAGGDDQEFSEWRKTKLVRALTTTTQKLAEQWEQRVTQDVYDLMAIPGARVAGAEIALEMLHKHFQKLAQEQAQLYQEQMPKTALAWREVEKSLQECAHGSGGFRLFGGRSKTRQLRMFLEKLSQYAHLRLSEELIGAARQVYSQVVARLDDRVRDLGFCRQRLRHLQENLDRPMSDDDEELNGTRPTAGEITAGRSPLPSTETFWDTIRQSDSARVVLPGGDGELEHAALGFLHKLSAEHWLQLDRELHEKVLEPQGGLNGACMSGELTRQMALPLLEGTTLFLNQHLPIMDVAQIIRSEINHGESCLDDNESLEGLKDQTLDYLQRASAPWMNRHGHKRHEFLLVPASNAGTALSESVTHLFPGLKIVRVPGQPDLMFLCEQGCDVQRTRTLVEAVPPAYELIGAVANVVAACSSM